MKSGGALRGESNRRYVTCAATGREEGSERLNIEPGEGGEPLFDIFPTRVPKNGSPPDEFFFEVPQKAEDRARQRLKGGGEALPVRSRTFQRKVSYRFRSKGGGSNRLS